MNFIRQYFPERRRNFMEEVHDAIKALKANEDGGGFTVVPLHSDSGGSTPVLLKFDVTTTDRPDHILKIIMGDPTKSSCKEVWLTSNEVNDLRFACEVAHQLTIETNNNN